MPPHIIAHANGLRIPPPKIGWMKRLKESSTTMKINPYTSGRKNIYTAINILQDLKKRLAVGSKERTNIEQALRELYRGQYLNEEQLKAMYQLGYTDPPTTGWLDDDFD